MPASAHDWHVPVQALPQHTPCAQNPDKHSAAAAHAAPGPFFTQLVPMQVNGAVQSAVVAHDVLHAPVPHVYGSHGDVAAAWQTPVPLHERDDVNVEPVHADGEQVVPLAYSRQPPAPSQKPSAPQVDGACIAHWLSGSAPDGTLLHVPALPVSAHDRQVPVHAVAQHTPCSQNPVTHSEPAAHVRPAGFFPHAPLLHTLGETQSPSVVHAILHSVSPHVYTPHDCGVVAWQVPVPLQVRGGVNVAPVQLAGAQAVPLGY